MLLAHDRQQVLGPSTPRELPVQLSVRGAIGPRSVGDAADSSWAEHGRCVLFYKHNQRKDKSLFPFLFNPIEKF